jgi:DNA gyrase inhibitor GyrI/AraC-like DNA-binding protein
MTQNHRIWKERVARRIQDLKHIAEYGDEENAVRFERAGSYYRKQFKKYVGESPFSLQRRLRLERGVYLLRKTGFRVCDIAAECGYETQEAFAKAFKKAFGLTPSELRKLPTWSGGLFSPIHYHYKPEPEAQPCYILNLEGGMAMNMKIVTLDSYRVVALKGGGDYWGMPKTWQTFHKVLKESDLYAKALSFLSIFHDHHAEIPMEHKRWDTGIIVKETIPVPATLDTYLLPGGLYAVYVHFGSCEEIGPAWEAWTKAWLADSAYQIDSSRPSLEWYQSSLSFLPPEMSLTFLCDPVKEKKP